MNTFDLMNIAFLPLERRKDSSRAAATREPSSFAPVEGSSSPCADTGTAGVSGSSLRKFISEVMLPTFAPAKPQDVRSMAELHLGKPIVTTRVYPPIPCRQFDWCAYPEGEEEEGNYGWGKTEAEAIADLIQILRDDERIPEVL